MTVTLMWTGDDSWVKAVGVPLIVRVLVVVVIVKPAGSARRRWCCR